MPQYPRYAIYFVPSADSVLYRFGASLLGYDAFTGKALPFVDAIETQIDDWKQITVDPRKYGFHATLKAPITLAPGKTEKELVSAIEAFAQTPHTIPVITPVVRAIGSFIAIVPNALSSDLQAFAADCVTTFDNFRAPLTPEDRARRNISALTEKQIAHLDRWGYPYVFEEFRFHMTLTGSLPAERREGVLDVLQTRFACLDLSSIAIEHLALLRQSDVASQFTVIGHWPLKYR
ncbi:putative phosphonate metabolism protein [Nitrobacteraceae bacterium AZCC 1564]